MGVSLIVGVALGTRFNVLIVGLAIFVDLSVIAGTGAALGFGIWSNVFLMALSATGLQIGYLVGIAIRLADLVLPEPLSELKAHRRSSY